MKNTLLITLLAFLSPHLIFAQSADSSAILRLNGIYVDEIIDGGDDGTGATVEFSIVLDETDDVFQTVGLEIGYITSEAEEFGDKVDTDLVPFLFNYTVGGPINESGFVWEVGAGIGVYFVEVDVDSSFFGSASDDDVIIGGQLFGSMGYKFTESASLLAGIRYMIAEDASFAGGDLEILNSAAFDLSLNFAF